MQEYHPHEYWLRGLIATGMSDAGIIEVSEQYRYNPISKEYLAQLRHRMMSSRPQQPNASTAGRRWLKGQRILAFVALEPHVVSARELLGDHLMRPMLELLLISGADDIAIEEGLKRLNRNDLTARVIRMYRHYFWNVGNMPMEYWATYCKTYQGDHGKKLRRCQGQGIQQTLWAIGMPVYVSASDAFNDVFQEAYFRFKEMHTAPNGQSTALASKMWADTMGKMHERGASTGDKLREAAEKVGLFTLRLGRREISALETLESTPAPAYDAPAGTDGSARSTT